jgi:hypothetical protein
LGFSPDPHDLLVYDYGNAHTKQIYLPKHLASVKTIGHWLSAPPRCEIPQEMRLDLFEVVDGVAEKQQAEAVFRQRTP